MLEQMGFPIHYDEMLKQYDKLPKISFDYEVVEKAKEVAVISYDGYWKDLGTWNTLTEEMGSCQLGKGIITNDCVNTHLINELDIPVTLIGLTNIVVAASPDGILVTDKSASPRIKEIVNYDQGPMYEERQWGWCKILDIQNYEDGEQVITKKVSIQAGKNLSYCMSRNRQEVWTMVKGKAEFIHNGNYMIVKAGNVLHIPSKTLHGLKAINDVEFIVVQTGPTHSIDDMVEFYSLWTEIEQHCIKI
ncbi:Mannose-1-phosphate guanylyltransferase 1 [compost metagenome]